MSPDPDPVTPDPVTPEPTKVVPAKPDPAQTVDIKSFIDLQKEYAKLEKANKQLLVDKEEVERTSILQELTRVNKKMALAKKDESLSTLKIVLATVTEMKGVFPELDDPSSKKKPKKEGTIVGYTLLGSDKVLGIE